MPNVEDSIIEPAVVDECRVAQRAVGDRDRHPADGVVDDLVPRHDLHRVGARLAVDGEGEHWLVLLQEVDLSCGDERRVVDRRDPVGRWTSAADLVEVDERLGGTLDLFAPVHGEPGDGDIGR